ncbi:unnamed protein product [Mytilus coruscus]|uniref:Uncharacterized protein n=1 Tax=Mytilus coruscus TaxID=42192 RepID=A0A6J8EEG5_MYTCO|nr:unnamed protein product [Mytilus coruscus]
MSFKVETLLASLKEIQQEKSYLEQKLNERRNRRRQLEQELESVNGKYLQIKDVHTKMNETLKVAQHKVSQTQSLADSLDDRNEYYKKSIEDLNQKLNVEKKGQMEEVTQFEENLSLVSDNLCSARTVFTDENLQNCLTEAENIEKKLHERVISYQNSLLGMEAEFDKLKINPKQEPYYSDIPVELRRDMWLLFQDEHHKATECLQDIQGQIDSAKQLIETI